MSFTQENIALAERAALFEGIRPEELEPMLRCIGASAMSFERGKTLLEQGDPVKSFGLVLSGSAHVVAMDDSGNCPIIENIEPGDVFALTLACTQASESPVSVIAAAPCSVLFFEHARLMRPCSNACRAHLLLMANLTSLLAQKTLALNRRLVIATRRTVREKLMTYLAFQKKAAGSASFSIPFDRQGLANYLGVDRSALSAQIGKLKREGVIACRKSQFHLLV